MSTDAQPRFSMKKVKKLPGAPSTGMITGAPALPQVNLLPASIRARRALQRVKVLLLLVLGVVVIGALLGYVASMLSVSSAQSELETVQAETLRLQQEQSTYSEVPQIKAAIANAELARSVGMGSEILWSDYLYAVLLHMPTGSQLTGFATTAMNPLEGPPVPADPLVEPGVGSVTITHRSPTLPDTAAWINMLNGIEGMHDAEVLTQTIGEDDGVVYYEVTSIVQLSADALSGRFSPEGDSK